MTKPIRFDGWWGEEDRAECPEPWERFTVMVHGEEAGDYREATVEDLALAGFVPLKMVEQAVEEVRKEVASWSIALLRWGGNEALKMLSVRLRQQMGGEQ